MDTVAIVEKSIAFVFAFIVGGTTTIQLRNDWNSKGLDAFVTKILLGLMAFGCVLVILATLGVFGGK
jgi:uncharacterized membrane protein